MTVSRSLPLVLVAAVTIAVGAVAAGQQSGAGIVFLEDRVARDPDDILALNMLADLYLDRLGEGGDDADLTRAADAVQRSMASVPAELNGAAIAVQVRVDQASHRFEQARVGAARLVAAMPREGGYHALLGSALLELGRVDDAAKAFATAEHLDGKQIHTQSGLANIARVRGQDAIGLQHLQTALALAEAHFPPAAPVIAWAHAQIGQYWFVRGRWSEAQSEYLRALTAVSDHLLTREYLAELAAARGDYAAASDEYQQVIARSSRPEFKQALGDVLTLANKPLEAQRLYDQALEGYLHSVRSGHVHYYHHLTGFFSDSRPDGKAAVSWARKDLALRQSVGAYDAYAWALYVDGQFDVAAEAAARALRFGTDDAHVLYHAGMIASRQGNIERGAELLQRAVQVNPHYYSFHVHR